MTTSTDPRGYLVAPLFAPTVHVLLTPIWVILSGHTNQAFVAMGWQVIAWFAIEAICLATISPLLWLVRNQISRLAPGRSVAWSIATLFAVAASYLLFRSVASSWFAAFASAVVIFARFQVHENRSLQAPPPKPSFSGTPGGGR